MQQPEIVVDAIMAIHIIAGFGALFIGIVLIWLWPKTASARNIAIFWQCTMLVMLITSFDIKVMQPGSYSPVHALSVLVLIALALECWSMWVGREKLQRITRVSCYVALLLIFGAIVSTDGGVINRWFFA